jgi:hypothetical protein
MREGLPFSADLLNIFLSSLQKLETRVQFLVDSCFRLALWTVLNCGDGKIKLLAHWSCLYCGCFWRSRGKTMHGQRNVLSQWQSAYKLRFCQGHTIWDLIFSEEARVTHTGLMGVQWILRSLVESHCIL